MLNICRLLKTITFLTPLLFLNYQGATKLKACFSETINNKLLSKEILCQ